MHYNSDNRIGFKIGWTLSNVQENLKLFTTALLNYFIFYSLEVQLYAEIFLEFLPLMYPAHKGSQETVIFIYSSQDCSNTLDEVIQNKRENNSVYGRR